MREHHADTSRLRVSVIVPNYNYGRFLEARLASIFAQTRPVDELIVLDDASTDDSREVIRQALAGRSNASLVENDRNSGSPFRQWELGARLAKGDLLWIAEADDWCEPGLVHALASAFSDPDMVLAYCQSRQVDEDGRELAPDYLHYTDAISRRWHTDYTRLGSDEIADALSIKNTIPNASAVLFRREALLAAFDAVGGGLASMRFAGDWLLYLHVLALGKLTYRCSPLNRHRRHRGSVTSGRLVRRHLAEIALVQERARALVPVPPGTRDAAEGVLLALRAGFGIDPPS